MKTFETLRAQYITYKENNPKARIRNAAQDLNVSEMELLMLGVDSGSVMPLQFSIEGIFPKLESLGFVMALTRNDHAVHERKGVYSNYSFENNHAILFLNDDIDLRIFPHGWAYAFAVNEGGRQSLQFFDKTGLAVHKIYLVEQSNVAAYEKLINNLKITTPIAYPELESQPTKPIELTDEQIDKEEFQSEWLGLKDTHDFFGLCQRYKVSRLQALRLAPEGFAQIVDNNKAEELLQEASKQKVPIMCFVGNTYCIQIHTGTVENLMRTGPWYNVLDEKFNLHLGTNAIAHTYKVIKPGVDGPIHSLECYDNKGELIVQFFGKRKPGIPELPEWFSLITAL